MRRRDHIFAALACIVMLAGGPLGCDRPQHESVAFGGEDGTCDDCHMQAYDGAAFDHRSVNYDVGCAECHLETNWAPIFEPDHDRFFELLGRHAEQRCRSCHAPGRVDPQPMQCVGCHAADAAAADPSHESFPTTCDDCHGNLGWRPASFGDHDRWWVLDGAHSRAACGGCHIDEVYRGTPRDCIDCHRPERDRAEIDHSGLSVQCTDCHTTTAWQPADFGEHDEWWVLDGAHDRTPCGDCHVNGVYEGTPTACVDCHRPERDRAEPDHAGFPARCTDCHTTAAWQPASFGDHDDWWPLRGQHARTECGDCHIDGVYEGTPQACVGCHQSDRDRAEPDHADFPRGCAECHTEAAWRPAAFDHDATFPIEGAHLQNTCQDCHIGERYAGTPRTCVGCHAPDRDRAQPTHARFGDTCTACHTQAAFSPATYRHPVFRVPHEGVRRCLDCHTDPQDYSNVGCTSCHEHRRSEVDPEHRGIDGYRYEDAACLECHPDGGD